MNELHEQILAGERIHGEDLLRLEREADLHTLGFLANSVRRRLHPEPVVTYVIDRNINYTDICVSACKFCAFFKAPDDPAGSTLSREELLAKIEEFKNEGCTLFK